MNRAFPEPGMACHRALRVEEILHAIFDQMHDSAPSSQKQRRQSLARCAVSCKGFSDAALRTLWRDMDSLRPFLRLLPTVGKQNQNFQCLCGPITKSNWARFDRYAKYLQALYLPYDEDEHVDSFVYLRLSQLRKDRPLFPCLRALTVGEAEGKDNKLPSGLLLFLSPSIRTISFRTTEPEHSFGISLHALATESPKVGTLTIVGEFSRELLRPILSFQHLRTLSLTFTGGYVDMKFLRALSSKNLLDLTIGLGDHSFTGAPGTAMGFQTLQRLEVVGRLSVATQFVAMINPIAALRECHIRVTDGETSGGRRVSIDLQSEMDTFRQCLTTLASRFRHSLTSVTVTDNFFYELPPNAVCYDSCVSILEPLLELGSLKVLKIDLEVPLSLSDEDIDRMALAWPSITQLEVLFAPKEAFTTLLALHSLASLCPHLESLSLYLDASTEKIPDFFNPAICLDHGLRTLFVSLSPIKSPRLVARHLDGLFPSLHKVSSYDDSNSRRHWETVNDLLKTFHEIRRDQDERHVRNLPRMHAHNG